MIRRLRIAACYLLMLHFFALSVHADVEQEYDELHARYLKLRNTDIRAEKKKEWESLGDELVAFSLRNRKHRRSAFAIFDASILYATLYDFHDETEDLDFAESLLNQILTEYPSHPLAVDALMKKADLYRLQRLDDEGARRFYEQLLQSYPQSELALVAKSKRDKLLGLSPPAPVERKKLSRQKRPSEFSRVASPIVVIDPGHGGEDQGAVGVAGLREKDVVLAVSFQLKKILEAELGATVRMTRTNDAFVPLLERTAMANDFGADLFVSLHANASPKGKLSGLEVYYLDNSGDQSSKKLAERENKSFAGQQEGIGDLQFMLSDLIQNAKLEESISLANLIERGIHQELNGKWKTRSLGVKKAPFYVLVGAHMPCVLVEMFFIDHENDAKKLALSAFRGDLAQGIAAGIKNYLKQERKSSSAG